MIEIPNLNKNPMLLNPLLKSMQETASYQDDKS